MTLLTTESEVGVPSESEEKVCALVMTLTELLVDVPDANVDVDEFARRGVMGDLTVRLDARTGLRGLPGLLRIVGFFS